MAQPGLSFSPGLRFQDEIRATLGLPVSSSISDLFLLVVAFGRYKFKLSLASVGLILQATIGGNPLFFKVPALGDWVFKFSLASKAVGLGVRILLSFDFKLFFHLWEVVARTGALSSQHSLRKNVLPGSCLSRLLSHLLLK